MRRPAASPRPPRRPRLLPICLALCAALPLGGCFAPVPDPSLGGGQGALAGLGGAGMTAHSAGSGASINDILSPGATTTTGPGGIYPPLQ